MDSSDRPPATETLNPYRAPAAPVHDGHSEADIRRDGRFLVIGLHGALHSVCGHCGSTRDLEPRSTSVVWRNPVGCLTTLAFGVVVLVTVVSASHIPGADDFVGWAAG